MEDSDSKIRSHSRSCSLSPSHSSTSLSSSLQSSISIKTKLTSYALLGSGRVARHFQFYLSQLGLPVHLWSRNGDSKFNTFSDPDPEVRLKQALANTSHILCAVRDEAIEPLVSSIAKNEFANKIFIHFAGSLHIPRMYAAHPLMTFGPDLESLEWYKAVPFVIDEGAVLGEILPGLPNPSWSIQPEQRALYHALCSLAGNASFLLWQNIGEEFERSLGLPRQLLAPFLRQVVVNAAGNKPGAFTGPVARGDWQTIVAHLHALHQTRPELQKAYHDYLILADGSGHPIPEGMI
jgi:2-dehydropantoate 2-reductase